MSNRIRLFRIDITGFYPDSTYEKPNREVTSFFYEKVLQGPDKESWNITRRISEKIIKILNEEGLYMLPSPRGAQYYVDVPNREEHPLMDSYGLNAELAALKGKETKGTDG